MKRVLVVDDDEEMRALMTTLLSGRYQVSAAADGASGLAAARELKPDLVVLDLLMPKMHGFEVCTRIRADETMKTVKVLISSSKSYPHDVRTALDETGADAYIVKPFSVEAFCAKVDEMLAAPRS